MDMARGDDDERQARLDWMITEFRDAQTRRSMRADKVAESKPAANRHAPSEQQHQRDKSVLAWVRGARRVAHNAP